MRMVLVLGVLSGLAYASEASAQSCSSLYAQRNLIYKQGGYCFKTARAIGSFGNAGCIYDSQNDVPLSANQRAQVNRIIAMERAYGCR